MKSNNEYKVTDNLAVILVGEPKVGKTRTMMAFPDPYILDLDKNLNSAIRVADGKTFYYDQVDVEEIVDMKTGVITQKPVPEEMQFTRAKACLEAAIKDPRVKTLCIDSVTRLGELIKAHIIGQLKSMGLGSKLRADTVNDQIRLVDYDTYANLMLQFVAITRASGKMVVWTSHQTADKSEIDGRFRYFFSVVGKLKDTLGGYFTDVWGMSATPETKMVGGKAVQATKYSIRTKPSGYHVALGTSLDLATEIDVTDKSPKQIWELIAPKLSSAQPKTT